MIMTDASPLFQSVRDPTKIGLQIAGLGNGRMDRVIGSLTARLDELYVLAGTARRLADRFLQLLGAQVIGARTRDEKSFGRKHLQSELVESLIGGLCLRQVFLALGKGRRIDDHDVEARALARHFFERIERVLLSRADLQAIGLGVLLGELERRRRAVDAQHVACAARRGAQTPGADVAENVEHARSGTQVLRQGAPISRLVEEPARLLTFEQRRFEPQAVLDDAAEIPDLTDGLLDAVRQPLHIARGAVILVEQRPNADRLLQSLLDLRLEAFHARRADLCDAEVIEPVDDQARQAVRFAVNQTIVGRRVQSLAQGERGADSAYEPRYVGKTPGFEQARTDQRLRIDVGKPEGAVVVRDHAHQLARLEFGQRSLAGVDFIAEHP